MAAQYLEKFDLCPIPFTKDEKRRSKTPDFRVFRDGEFAFFAEVKTIEEDRWLDELLDSVPPGVIVGGSKPDPTYNTLSAKITQAAKQFLAVNLTNAEPNVLLFSCFEGGVDYGDLLSVLTGYAFLEGGEREIAFTKYSEGRIRDDRNLIDLYVWLAPAGAAWRLFNILRPDQSDRVAQAFSADLDKIEMLVK